MCLTEEEGQYDYHWIKVCETRCLPNNQCICGYHESNDVQKVDASDDDVARVQQLLREGQSVTLSFTAIEWARLVSELIRASKYEDWQLRGSLPDARHKLHQLALDIEEQMPVEFQRKARLECVQCGTIYVARNGTAYHDHFEPAGCPKCGEIMAVYQMED